jgi:hypothetical protein
MDLGKITEPLMQIYISQWCDSASTVLNLITNKTVTLKHLYDAGCHWVPPKLPIKGTLLEVVTEVRVDSHLFHVVKFSSEFINGEVAYSLLRVIQ